MTFIFPFNEASKQTANPLVGEYTIEEAIGVLLNGTRLQPEFSSQGVMTVLSYAQTVSQGTTVEGVHSMPQKTQQKTSLIKRLALVVAAAFVTTAGAQTDDGAPGIIEEVVVTASKRETTLQDTAMAISAISGEDLRNMGYTTLQDFIETVPGVTSLSGGPANDRLVMRGISNSIIREGNASTSRYIDEFPLVRLFASDLKLLDMQRVEVLRGPQGTLYGKAAMGGTVRYITNKPSTEGMEAGFSASLSDTAHSGDTNYSFDGYLNLPLTDRFAIRAVAYHYKDAGFIDSVPITGLGQFAFLPSGAQPGELLYPGIEDINDAEYTGGRLSLSYQITDNVSLDATWVTQNLDSGGIWDVQPETPWTTFDAIEDLQAAHPYPSFSEDTDFNLFGLSLNAGFKAFDMTVHAAHTDYDSFAFNSVTLFLSGLFGLGDSYDIPGLPSERPSDFSADTAEIRLVSNGNSRFNWILGGYYEDVEGDQGLLTTSDSGRAGEIFGPFLGTEAGFVALDVVVRTGNREKAVYGEIGYDFSDQWSATFGYRRADVSVFSVSTKEAGAFGNPANVGVVNEADEIAETYKALVEYRPTDDLLLFALSSSGYRAGGKNPNVLGNPGNSFTSDSLWNNELGVKSTWLDGRFTANASLYRLDWDDMQLQVTLPGGSAEIANVGKAKITGFEGEFRLQATDQLGIGVNYTHINGELAEDYNPTLDPSTGVDSLIGDEGFKGDRLPGSAKDSFSVFVDWTQQLSGNYRLYARAHYRYVGDRTVDFNPLNAIALGHPNFVELPSYQTTNLVVGVGKQTNSGNSVQLELYANNLFDERAQVAYVDFYSDQVYVNRPRTVGVRVRMDF